MLVQIFVFFASLTLRSLRLEVCLTAKNAKIFAKVAKKLKNLFDELKNCQHKFSNTTKFISFFAVFRALSRAKIFI